MSMSYEELQQFIKKYLAKRQVDISELYPDIYNSVLEKLRMATMGNQVLGEYQRVLNKWMNNQYIYGADSQGLTVFEAELGIKTDLSENLRTRQERIIAILNQPVTKFTKVWLKRQLDHEFGVGNYQHEIRYAQYELWIQVRQFTEYIKEFMVRLRYQIPANIYLKLEVSREKEHQKLYGGIARVLYGNRKITTAIVFTTKGVKISG